MRAIWKGSINFGLVHIPVAVYSATREDDIEFRQLRARDLSPIRYKKVAEVDQKEVPADQIVKGYEYGEGRWIVLSDEDFDQVQIESTHSVDITDFIELASIDPKYFYKPYFLEAQKGGEKAYALLHQALQDTGKVGVAKVAIRNREYLAAVKPDGPFLVLELMHFADEVLQPDELENTTDSASVSPRELNMAKSLIEAMTSEWDPSQYRDQYQDALMEMIEAKANKLPRKPAKKNSPAPSNVIDLVSVLQQSLERKPAKGSKAVKAKPAGKGSRPEASPKSRKRSSA